MKLFSNIAALFFSCLLMINCGSDDDSSDSNQVFSPEMLNGTWRISFFSDENETRTAEFNGYHFSFNTEDETALITFNNITEMTSIEVFEDLGNNNWVLYTDFDNIDSLGEADLDDLVEDWIVKSVNSNATVIEFEELYSNNKPEILHLTKISNEN